MRVVAFAFCALAVGLACGVSARAGARRTGTSIWYDAATRAEFCGITKPSLDAAAFAEFEVAWAKAFGAKDKKACGEQTARAVFDKIKAGQVKAAGPAKDYSDFAKLATECARELTTQTGVVDPNGYGLWSGGFHCSEVAHAMFGVTVLERTQLGNILTQVFAYPTGPKAGELAPAWHDCCGNMWNALSTKYVDQMTGKCTIFFRYGGEDSVLYRQELPALQKLLDARKLTEVVFEVVLPDGAPQCGVRPGLRTVVPAVGLGEHDLRKVLKDLTKRANEQQPGSVPVVSQRAPPPAQTLLSRMRKRIGAKRHARARTFGAKRQV